MALLVDKTTSKKLENRLSEFTGFGMALYYLFEKKRTNIKDLESIFFSEDDEKSSFIYKKIMKNLKPSDLKESYEKYSLINPKKDGEDDSVYKKCLNILYTKKIINQIVCQTNDKIDKTYLNTYEYLLTNLEMSR